MNFFHNKLRRLIFYINKIYTKMNKFLASAYNILFRIYVLWKISNLGFKVTTYLILSISAIINEHHLPFVMT